MIELEIDGRKVEVREGGTVMDAATNLGIYVPHFCYHRKLSIAANCRMCLVDIEKAPKPMPACATPATAGMVVRTASPKARDAQRSVMEFLLINHPLDCPICDQGGECQLQDLAVGYGPGASRYQEEKRVVLHKDLGPLVSAQEMSRCIHCTRCVRFGQEVAGVMELGMAGHGEHSEILPFVGRTVDSELSGNMIDVCPVGALTSKPFRYRARTWELARRRSVAPHDALGSGVVLQVHRDEVVRVLPLENEDLNECWLSDRDRFSYEGLAATDRVLRPLVRRDGVLVEATWPEALAQAARSLGEVCKTEGPQALAALGTAGATAEELWLLAGITRGLGSQNIDFRARQADFRGDATRAGAPWLGLPVAELSGRDRVLLVGAFLREDHPVVAARLRRAVQGGARLAMLDAGGEDPLMPLAQRVVDTPAAWVWHLARLAAAVAALRGQPVPAGAPEPDAQARALAALLCGGERPVLLAGNAVAQHPDRVQLQAWIECIAGLLGCPWGHLGEGANSVGGYLAGAVPVAGGLDARAMFESPRGAYLLLGVEPAEDCADPARAVRALAGARAVVALSAYRNPVLDACAHVVLPIVPFTETSGSFVNCEGRLQGFNGAVPAAGEARPGWKVLRVLANELGLAGFDHESPEQVRAQALPADIAGKLDNRGGLAAVAPAAGADGVERLAGVAPYAVDAVVRRAGSLQRTAAARLARTARAHPETLARFGVQEGSEVRVRQGEASVVMACAADPRLAPGVVRIAAGTPESAALGAMSGSLTLERA